MDRLRAMEMTADYTVSFSRKRESMGIRNRYGVPGLSICDEWSMIRYGVPIFRLIYLRENSLLKSL